MTETQRLIARARLLRRSGKTYAEIRTALGVQVGDDRLQSWLRGIPRPPETHRSRALVELRRECRRLRSSGLTYDEIHARTGATKGSMSLWLRGVPGPGRKVYDLSEHFKRIQPLGTAARKLAAERRREAATNDGKTAMGQPSARDIFVAGVALYWAEGAKDKPWRRTGRVVIINGDPDVLRLFLRWLDLLGIPEEARHYRLNIHESADAQANEYWWSEAVHVPLASFGRATLKRHNPSTTRHNTGADYHGCLVISVRRSRALYDAIAGAWQALVSDLDGTASRAP